MRVRVPKKVLIPLKALFSMDGSGTELFFQAISFPFSDRSHRLAWDLGHRMRAADGDV